MKTENDADYKLIIFYDGYCKICNWWTRFVIQRDYAHVFEFEPVTSSKANQFFDCNQRLSKDAITVWDQKKRIWIASKAVFKIVSHMKGLPRGLLAFKLLPTKFNDWVYYIVARNRYKFFKKSETCQLPT